MKFRLKNPIKTKNSIQIDRKNLVQINFELNQIDTKI